MNEETLKVTYEDMVNEYKKISSDLMDEKVRLTCLVQAANKQMTAYKQHIQSQDSRISELEHLLKEQEQQ